MKYYVMEQSKPAGPFEGAEIRRRFAQSGKLDPELRVCPVGSSEWRRIADQDEFIDLFPPPGSAAPNTPVAATILASNPNRRATKTSPGFRFTLWILFLFIVALVAGWFGLALGLALIVWGAIARKKAKISFVGWVLNRPPSHAMSYATLGLGIGLSTCSAARVTSDYGSASRAEKLAEVEQERVRLATEQRDTRRRELEAAVPQKLSEWKATLSAIKKESKARVVDPTAAQQAQTLKSAFISHAQSAQSVGATLPMEELRELASETEAVAELIARRSKLDSYLEQIPKSINEGKAEVQRRDWLGADGRYDAAEQMLEEIKNAEDWSTEFLPSDFNLEQKAQEIQQLRRQIASAVASAQAAQEHERVLSKISSVRAELSMTDRGSYEQGIKALDLELTACGRCKGNAALVAAVKEIRKELNAWPIELNSLQEMQTRYADLKGRKVRVQGVLSASTYYNCRFSAQSQYRSFEIADKIMGGIHVYCSRGDGGCETIFDSLASGGSQRGTAILEYPSSNSVCAEGQAFLLSWSH